MFDNARYRAHPRMCIYHICGISNYKCAVSQASYGMYLNEATTQYIFPLIFGVFIEEIAVLSFYVQTMQTCFVNMGERSLASLVLWWSGV